MVASPAPQRRRTRWSRERLEVALREYVGDATKFPTNAQLERDGRHDLVRAIKYGEGQAAWAERLGLERGPGQDRAPYTPTDAIRDARTIIAQEGYLPGLDRIRAAGWPRLASHIQRSQGNTSKFVAACGDQLT